jgi:hypothetical protein
MKYRRTVFKQSFPAIGAFTTRLIPEAVDSTNF